jgi:hypothetical protein
MRFLLIPLLVALMALSSCSGKRLPEPCYLQPESGKCRASLMRWYRDDRTGTCKAFVWGGCEGVVPFETRESCMTQCMAGSAAEDAAVTPVLKTVPAPQPAAAPVMAPATPATDAPAAAP